MKRLSIIVPIYNVEKYVSKCLDSLLAQDISFNDYEIIIVNDGSTDRGLEIAKLYVSQFPDIKLISQKNEGLGAARNAGIRMAKGKYLFFVDSDDSIRPNCLDILLDRAETNNLDILRFNYETVNNEGKIIPKRKNSTHSQVFSEKVVDGIDFLTDHLGWACYSWSFLFNASFLKNNTLFFNPTIYFEDVEWLVRVLTIAQRVQSIDKQVYFYQQRLGSITQSVQFEKKNKIISDKLYIVQFLKKYSQTENLKKAQLWCNGMIALIFMGILAYVENELSERKQEIISLLHDQRYLPLKSYRFTLKQKRDVWIINLSPRLFCFLKRRK